MAVVGCLPDILKYFRNSPNFLQAFEYFKSALDTNSLVHKRIHALPMIATEKVLLTDDCYALEQRYTTKKREDCFFESHRKYIDIQMVVSGSELMEHVHISQLQLSQNLLVEKDLIIYQSYSNDFTNKILLKRGDFAIYFPEDAHMGGQMNLESEACFKTVVKIPINAYQG